MATLSTIFSAAVLTLLSAHTLAQTPDPRISSIISGLRPPIAVEGEPDTRWSLSDRMSFYTVPGVSIALVDQGKIIYAEGFGVKAAGETASVKADTLFQAASISKPVAAIGILNLVNQGTLDLDADVNTKLKSWKVPDSEFTSIEKVTLRRILSHSAGLTVHGFAGYSKSETLPTLVQILDGAAPAKSPPVRVDRTPGEGFRYSGGGTTVAELLIADVTGESPSTFLNRTVLSPLEMTSSTFTQPLPDRFASQAATGYDPQTSKPLDGRWHIYPMTFAAGLWTTPTDLCRIIIATQKAAAGTTTGPVSPATAKEMLTPAAGSMGLGFALNGSGEGQCFSHNGGNDGFRCMLEATVHSGKGFVIMTNSDSGVPVMRELVRAIKHEFNWPDTDQKRIKPVQLDELAMNRVVGSYALPQPPGAQIVIFAKEGQLRLRTEGTPEPLDLRLVPTSPSDFVAPDLGFEIRADLTGTEPASALIVNGRRRERIPAPK